MILFKEDDKDLPEVSPDDDSVLVRIKPLRYNHDVVLYVPVFQKNFDTNGKPLYSPTFTYCMADATQDEQLAWSHGPDYVLVLKGTFDATTKPFLLKERVE